MQISTKKKREQPAKSSNLFLYKISERKEGGEFMCFENKFIYHAWLAKKGNRQQDDGENKKASHESIMNCWEFAVREFM